MTGIYSRVQPVIIITVKVTIRVKTAVDVVYVSATCVYTCMYVSSVCMCASVYVCVQSTLIGPFVSGPVLVLCPSDWILSQQSP